MDQPTREGLVAALIGLGAGLVLLMWWMDTPPTSIQGSGPWLTATGRITGLLGAYLIVMGVQLMSRVTLLDRFVGMDRLAVWHRRIAPGAVERHSVCVTEFNDRVVTAAKSGGWDLLTNGTPSLLPSTGTTVIVGYAPWSGPDVPI